MVHQAPLAGTQKLLQDGRMFAYVLLFQTVKALHLNGPAGFIMQFNLHGYYIYRTYDCVWLLKQSPS